MPYNGPAPPGPKPPASPAPPPRKDYMGYRDVPALYPVSVRTATRDAVCAFCGSVQIYEPRGFQPCKSCGANERKSRRAGDDKREREELTIGAI